MPFDDDIIRVRIPSATEMAGLDNAFGAYFLRPLLENPDQTVNQPVTALYGCYQCGKTTFADAAVTQLPGGLHEKSREPHSRDMQARLVRLKKSDIQTHYYRNYDFWRTNFAGFEEYKRDQGSETENFKLPGCDLWEHASIPLLRNAHVAVMIADNDDRST